MTPGLPGTGIGGLFYLLCALWMPWREIIRTGRGQSTARRWAVVGVQTGLAIAMLAGMWLTGWLFGFLVSFFHVASQSTTLTLQRITGQTNNILHIATMVMTFVTLAVVLLGVQVLRFTCKRPHRPTRVPGPQPTDSLQGTV